MGIRRFIRLMGSFNTTCRISNLIIEPGDKCKLILIRNNLGNDGADSGDAVYIDTSWSPITLPLDVTYEDYGNFSIIDTDMNKLILDDFQDRLRHQMVELDQGDNEYHDIKVNRDNVKWADIMSYIGERRLFTHKEGHYISFFAVNDEVYNHIIDTCDFSNWFRISSREDMTTKLHDAIEKFIEDEDEDDPYTYKVSQTMEMTDELMTQLNRANSSEGSIDDIKVLIKYLKSRSANDVVDTLSKYGDSLPDVAFPNTDIVDDLVNFVIFNSTMNSLHIPYHSYTYGSQSSNIKLVNNMAKKVSEITDRKIKEYDDEYGE
jgi:hypothetical protein